MEKRQPQSAEDTGFGEVPRAGNMAPDIELLYRLHWNTLCAWLRRRYGAGPPDPEDVAQVAFMKMATVENRAAIEDPRAYLFSIAANTALSGIRWFTRTQQFAARELEAVDHGLEEMSPERIHSSRERLSVVLGQLDALTDKQREIVMRSRIGGQTYEQIAAETGWSLADISRQLTMALKTMRRALEDYDGGDQDQMSGDRRSSR